MTSLQKLLPCLAMPLSLLFLASCVSLVNIPQEAKSEDVTAREAHCVQHEELVLDGPKPTARMVSVYRMMDGSAVVACSYSPQLDNPVSSQGPRAAAVLVTPGQPTRTVYAPWDFERPEHTTRHHGLVADFFAGPDGVVKLALLAAGEETKRATAEVWNLRVGEQGLTFAPDLVFECPLGDPVLRTSRYELTIIVESTAARSRYVCFGSYEKSNVEVLGVLVGEVVRYWRKWLAVCATNDASEISLRPLFTTGRYEEVEVRNNVNYPSHDQVVVVGAQALVAAVKFVTFPRKTHKLCLLRFDLEKQEVLDTEELYELPYDSAYVQALHLAATSNDVVVALSLTVPQGNTGARVVLVLQQTAGQWLKPVRLAGRALALTTDSDGAFWLLYDDGARLFVSKGIGGGWSPALRLEYPFDPSWFLMMGAHASLSVGPGGVAHLAVAGDTRVFYCKYFLAADPKPPTAP